MLKLSRIRKINKDILNINLDDAIKKFVLDYIEEEADDRNIQECSISFDCNSHQKDLDIDTVVSKLRGIVEESIMNNINEIINYKNIKLGDE